MKIKGKVVKGKGVGEALGYPTANLDCDEVPLVSAGVYAVNIKINNEAKNAIAIVGALNSNPLSVEVHILEWQADIYGATMELEILKKISEVEEFNDKNLLARKIKQDIKKAKKYFRQE